MRVSERRLVCSFIYDRTILMDREEKNGKTGGETFQQIHFHPLHSLLQFGLIDNRVIMV